ncbi:MAG: histidinol dehydrogenase, partial [Litorivicinaceae bacterium]
MLLKPVSLTTRDDNFEARLQQLTAWESVNDLSRETRVAEIIQAVRSEGDRALLRLTRELDQNPVSSVSDLVLDPRDLETAFHELPDDLRAALTTARDRVWAFHEAQNESSWRLPDQGDGIILGQEVRPMGRVGLYVPGGKATYPSSVLMNGIPAKVAGVPMVQMVVPAPKGELNPVVLAAAYLARVDRVVTVGGAQAIAALAYGTESVLSVDKIVGPGNAWVAVAKR